MASVLMKWGYLHNERVFRNKVLSIHQDFSFGGIALKIELVVFVYELINYLIIYEIIIFFMLGYVIIMITVQTSIMSIVYINITDYKLANKFLISLIVPALITSVDNDRTPSTLMWLSVNGLINGLHK